MQPVACAVCRGAMSPAAATCPHCGHPNAAVARANLLGALVTGLLALGALFGIYYFLLSRAGCVG